MARFKVSDEQLKYYDEENTMNKPQKEALKFHIDTALLAPQLVDVVLEIQKAAESSLYHWRTFPLNLPNPIAVLETSEGSASSRRKPLVLENLFDLPSWDDLDVVSVDPHGEAKHLSTKQLNSVRQHGTSEKSGTWRVLGADQQRSLRKTGTFTVPSINFPSQHHTWRLNPLLQTGSEVAMDSFLNTLAWAAAIINLTAYERFTGDIFSVRQSIQSFRIGIHHFMDLLIGIPSLQPKDFEARLQEERSRYLVAELLCAVLCQEEYITLCRFIRHIMTHQQSLNGGRMSDIRQQKAPPLPYIFQTPKGLLIDLRLFSREIMEKVKPVISSVLQQESKTRWSRNTVAEIKSSTRNKSNEAGWDSDGSCDAVEEKILARIWESLLNCPGMEQIEPGIGQLLVDQAKAAIAMKKAVGKVRENFTADLIQAEVDIRLRHPLLSLVKPWMDKQLREVKSKLAKEHKWKCHEVAIEACRHLSLEQFVYFLSRDLTFLRDRAPMLSKELWSDKQPTRNYNWDTWIWNPRAWIVRRHFQGNVEVITTHLSSTPTSITQPRDQSNGGQEQPVFTLERSSRRTTTTQWPFWRWANYLQRAWTWSWNGAYACGYIVPWCSPIGLRALFASQPFYADLELSQVNGALCPRRSAYTPTLNSRLASLWRHISKSRTEFETQPDTGFMGKGLTRQINRSWNYGFKGIICSTLLLFFFPIICILCSVGGVCLAFTAPLWAPICALFYHFIIVFIWDFDNPNSKRRPLFPIIQVVGKDLLLDGLIQPLTCLMAALVLCPLVSLLLALYGILKWMLVRARDATIYHLAIRPRGRIPASEGCFVKRIAGPGLNTEFYYQISKEQALAAFEARLETDRLIAYRRQTERLIRRPAEDFRLFVQQVFSPFSGVSWSSTPVTEKAIEKSDAAHNSSNFKSGNVAAQLERETQALLTSLEEKVERRLYELRMPLATNVLKKIRLSTSDLKMVLLRSAMMMRTFYPSEVLSRLGLNDTELWERYNVEEGDWIAMAAIFLGEIFSPTILNPLAEEETRIQLESKDANLSRYGAMFIQSDLDSEPFEWPLRTFSPQSIPLPDLSFFNPLAREAAHSSPPWKKKRTHQNSTRFSGSDSLWKENPSADQEANRSNWSCELLIPLPIPHPVMICLLIYNRHRDIGAIPLESESCRLLVRFLEGSTTLSTRTKDAPSRPSMVGLEVATTQRSPASHKPLLGSSGSDLALSQPSLAAEFSNSQSSSPSQHDTLVSIAQDGTLSLVGTLVSEHASVDIDLALDQDVVQSFSSVRDAEVEPSVSKGLSSTLARAADTLRVALLGEKVDESAANTGGRNFSTDNFELLPSSDDQEAAAASNDNRERETLAENRKKFPAYQSASFRSWRMNISSPLRYEKTDSTTKATPESQTAPASPRPLGLFELSSGLSSDRGPAFSPAQFSLGRRLLDRGQITASSSQDSLPFAEEDASLVDSPDWDQSKSSQSARRNQQPPSRAIGQPYCEVQQQLRPSAVLASIEDLSLSIDSQHTHLDITSQLGTQV